MEPSWVSGKPGLRATGQDGRMTVGEILCVPGAPDVGTPPANTSHHHEGGRRDSHPFITGTSGTDFDTISSCVLFFYLFNDNFKPIEKRMQ